MSKCRLFIFSFLLLGNISFAQREGNEEEILPSKFQAIVCGQICKSPGGAVTYVWYDESKEEDGESVDGPSPQE